MNSIIMNFNDTVELNAAFTKIRTMYPAVRMAKTDVDIENLEDEYLLALALERKKNDNGVRWTEEDIMRKFGITEEDLDNMEDVEIE